MKNNSLFSKKPVIGMIHLLPLPGVPQYTTDINVLIERALAETCIYQRAEIDGIIIENFNDNPYSINEITKEQLALMATIVGQIRKEITIPIGVNVHFNDWAAEMAIAFACKAQFIRVEVFVDTVVTSSGIVEPCCAKVTRYRKMLGAVKSIEIWADIHPKYSRNLLSTTLQESALMAKNALADAIIITGETTGMETPLDDIRKVKAVVDLPVIVGSGTNLANAQKILSIADGAIIGSAFKHEGIAHNKVSEKRLVEFMKVVKTLKH